MLSTSVTAPLFCYDWAERCPIVAYNGQWWSNKLQFGTRCIKSAAGIQQGDPIGPVLLSLVVLELLDNVGEKGYSDAIVVFSY